MNTYTVVFVTIILFFNYISFNRVFFIFLSYLIQILFYCFKPLLVHLAIVYLIYTHCTYNCIFFYKCIKKHCLVITIHLHLVKTIT